MKKMFKMSNEKPKVLSSALVPTLQFTPVALGKMHKYTQSVDSEIGWMGVVKKEGAGLYTCTDVRLLHQEVHSVTTEITPDALIKYAQEYPDDVADTLLWGHSHVEMGVSPSGQDDTQLYDMAENGCPYFFRVITNKRGDIGITFVDFAIRYTVTDVPWQLAFDLTEDIDKEIKEKVKEKPVLTYDRSAYSWYEGMYVEEAYDEATIAKIVECSELNDTALKGVPKKLVKQFAKATAREVYGLAEEVYMYLSDTGITSEDVYDHAVDIADWFANACEEKGGK